MTEFVVPQDGHDKQDCENAAAKRWLLQYGQRYSALNVTVLGNDLKVVDRTFKSFYGLINAVRSGSYQQKVKLPNYLPKEGYFLLIIPCGWGTRKDKKTG